MLTLKVGREYFFGSCVFVYVQYDNTQGAWLTQEGCTITERKEGM